MMSTAHLRVSGTSLLVAAGLGGEDGRGQRDGGSVARIPLLPPGAGNPRNSEGDFIRLRDGRLLFVYTHFTGGSADHATAHLAGRFSVDGGVTWDTEDTLVLPNEAGCNVMSVSLLRLPSGEIALFYARKNSMDDCVPCMRVSRDEGATWGEPTVCIEEPGYYVLNNDRVVQLAGGRVVVPVALHKRPEWPEPDWSGTVMCYLSDDGGVAWRRSRDCLQGHAEDGARVVLQEPGVVELKDGRLMMFCRTTSGCQYVSFSSDQGESWTAFGPSNMISPCSPATIERIPSTGDLLLAWNDHDGVDERYLGKRTPFNVAVSRDEGVTWTGRRTLEDDPGGWYCYTAMEFVGDYVLLGHCAGQRATGGLNLTRITRFPVSWLYE